MADKRTRRRKSKSQTVDPFTDSIIKWNAVFDRSQVPPLLYHYTDFDGLTGILSTNSLRANFSQTLSDGSEWRFGKEVVKRYARPVTPEVAKALGAPPSFIKPPPTAMFVTCFCQEPNLLSMWRSYTAMGGGFSLGFDGQALDDLETDDVHAGSYGARLVKIYYGKTLPPTMVDLISSNSALYAEWVLENMIKDDSFQEGQEWRIVVPDPSVSLMSFNRGHANIKASVYLKNRRRGRLPLKRLLYGPTLRDEEATRKVLTWMLQKYGYGEVVPEPSGIPYRL